MKVQAQWILDTARNEEKRDAYRLRKYSSNTLLLSMPAGDWNVSNLRDQIGKKMGNKFAEHAFMNALDAELHTIADAKRAPLFHLRSICFLYFPSTLKSRRSMSAIKVSCLIVCM